MKSGKFEAPANKLADIAGIEEPLIPLWERESPYHARLAHTVEILRAAAAECDDEYDEDEDEHGSDEDDDEFEFGVDDDVSADA